MGINKKIFTNEADAGDVSEMYADTFKDVFNLESLDLTARQWNHEEFQRLANVLKSCKKLMNIDFEGTRIPAKSLQVILEALATNESKFLDLVLNLRKCGIDDHCCEVLAEWGPKLRHSETGRMELDVSKNEITDVGMVHLAEHLLPHCPNLLFLSAYACRFGEKSFLALEKTAPSHPGLIHLSLELNEDPESSARQKLMDSWIGAGKQADKLGLH